MAGMARGFTRSLYDFTGGYTYHDGGRITNWRQTSQAQQ
ncbi:uncharacterized protein G2W53_024603 [Senna tora]|uniref:Uncharacterized protein n=1 Tax=Senna tora TaxID=362788 RepID=A0A834TBK0_9FABA|nr:uncharacterized protein G2W53_024603 [Senna tora]